MAESHSFRAAFNGFNREDVVRYIEYLNTKHTGIVNQLTSEKQSLSDELNALRSQTAELAELRAKIEALESERAELLERLNAQPTEAPADEGLRAEVEELKTQLADMTAQRDEAQAALAAQPTRDLAAEELEAYRRAERAERTAKERADQMYHQATATLAEATAQVDKAALQFRQVADRVNAQMGELQAAVEGSKAALLDAATTMYTIRPEGAE